MASVEVLEPRLKPETPPETLHSKLDKQVAEAVAQPEEAQTPERQQPAEWCYRVPFPGVRYYSF